MSRLIRPMVLGGLFAAMLCPTGSWCPAAEAGGDLTALSVLPEKVHLRGADRAQQLVVTGRDAGGGLRDLTHEATYRPGDPKVVQVREGGLLVPAGNGRTEVLAEVGGRSITVSVTVTDMERDLPINFTNEIVPLFSKLGCNSGDCHGKSGGQNGFALSLLGFEPHLDYLALTQEGRGRRLFPAAPEQSLLLLKPTGRLPHGGGRLLAADSPEYRRLLRWIRAGSPFGSPLDPRVVGISLAPEQRVLARHSRQQLSVTAHYSDGSTEDVTPRAEFHSNNPELVTIDGRGLARTLDLSGDGSVMVRYLGQVAVFRATVPTGAPLEQFVWHAPANLVDRHVFDKLKQLGIPPSDLCADSEFLRRAAIDITGTLPTPAEVEQFLADRRPDKRERLIDDLLNRPTYATYFTLKWADILRNRRSNDREGAARTAAFHAWICNSLEQNKPYDQFVREVVTALGPLAGENDRPPSAWYTELRSPQLLVDDAAQAFLGMRLQCAQCHHHPFEKWSQDDYWGLAAFFARVQWLDGNGKPLNGPIGAVRAVGLADDGRITSPQGKVYDRPKPLDADELTLSAGEDPRHKLMDWMTHPENPYFARTLVNRYWAHFFSRGIVDPPDDMRVTNPPTNPELLDALARELIEHRYDLKHLIRLICTSKTYQLSSVPNEYNRTDKQNFSRFLARRLPAEVLLDAIDQVTAGTSRFSRAGVSFPEGIRAIELPDEAVLTYFLTVFGKPKRESACECERSPNVTLAQRLHLLNSSEVQSKLAAATSRPALLAAEERPEADKVREIYLWTFARHPTPDELQTVTAHIARKSATPQGQREAYEDIFWTLINTKEFLFNH